MPEASFSPLSSLSPTAFQLWKRLSLWIFLIIVFSVPLVIFNSKSLVYGFDGFVKEENNYVIVETKDSGRFVGIKESSGDSPESSSDLKISNNGNTANSSPSSTVHDSESEQEKKIIYAFRGVPYAKPPIGPLRWKDPEPISVTSGPIDTTKYKSICPQWDSVAGAVVGDLDCLYLNIFTPRLHFSVSRTPGDGSPISQFDDDPRHAIRLLPVLVWIHPGNFLSGSGNVANPESFAESGDVLLVTLNYRLGTFGFLQSFQFDGNYGLLDQIAALKWINKNIHRFAGDPNRVTVAGDTLPLLLVPNIGNNYYSGMINFASSQNPFSPGFASSPPNGENKFFRNFVKEAKCSMDSAIQDCLGLKSPEELITLQQSFFKFSTYPRHTKLKLPESDSSQNFTFLPSDIENYFQSQEFLSSNIPILIGINSSPLQGQELAKEFLAKFPNIYKQALQYTLKLIIPTKMLESTEVFDEIWKFYFGHLDQDSQDYGADFKEQLVNLFGDITVSVPHQKLLEKLSQRQGLVFSFILESESELLLFNQNESISSNSGEVLRKLWISFTSYKTPKHAVGKQKNWSRFYRLEINPANQTVNYHIKPDGGKMRIGFKEKEAELWFQRLPDLYNSISHKYESDSSNNEDWTMLFWILISVGVAALFIVIFAILWFVCH